MKLKVLQQDFSKDLSIASRFASPKAQLPVLGNVLLRAKKNKLLIGATNLETSVLLSTGAQVEETGEITIPARTLSDIVSNLPKEHIELTVEKEKLTISAPGHSLDIPGMVATDFPDIPESITGEILQIDTSLFTESLSSVLFAASHDETRPVLTGVLVTIDETLSLVATDGFRLSQKELTGDFGKNKIQVILPKNTLSELTRLAGESETLDMHISEKESLCIFGIGDTVLSSRLIQGEFPNFSKIIPTSSRFTVSVNKDELSRGVKLASVFARDSANVVTFQVTPDVFKVVSASDTSGEQVGEIDAKISGDVDKDGVVIGFNYKFIEDFLGSVQGDSVEMKFIDENAAGVFVDSKQENYLHLIMPVKL